MKEIIVITGASQGLGLALARRLLAPGVTMLALQRHPSDALSEAARGTKAQLYQLAADMNDPKGAASALECWMALAPLADAGRATLICCAAEIGPIGHSEATSDRLFERTMRVNALAPMMLVRRFLALTADFSGERRVVCISSAAARQPVAGLSAYCASKAALDRFCETVAADEVGRTNAAKIVSLAPGHIETAMQETLRTASENRLPAQEKYINYQRDNRLQTPDAAAASVIEHMNRPKFGKRPIADIRD